MKRRNTLFTTLRLVAVALISLLWAVPMFMIVMNPFKTDKEIMAKPLNLPETWTLDNFKEIFSNGRVWEMYGNSLTITVCGVVLVIVVASLAGYYIARSRPAMGKKTMVYFLLGMMLPYIIVYIPLVSVYKYVGITKGLWGLILVFVSGNIPFAVFMYRGFVQSIPKELEEAAAIDGATPLQIFYKVVLPMLRPCTVTVIIFCGVGIWNDFMTPSIIGQVQTITVGVYNAIGFYTANWGLVFAYVFVSVLPVLIAYMLMQKEFVEGLSAGALKG